MTTKVEQLEIQNEIKGSSSTHTLPPGTAVVVNIPGIHHNESVWPHPEIIEPMRWLASNPNSYDPFHPSSGEQGDDPGRSVPIPNHTKGTFLTFNEGPRSCLGRKFAQVEFIAFFCGLLRRNRLVLGEGQSRDYVDRMLRLRGGGSPTGLTPDEDVKICLVPRD